MVLGTFASEFNHVLSSRNSAIDFLCGQDSNMKMPLLTRAEMLLMWSCLCGDRDSAASA